MIITVVRSCKGAGDVVMVVVVMVVVYWSNGGRGEDK